MENCRNGNLLHGIAVGAVYLVSPFIGREEAIVSIPIINGGLAATQIMTQAAMDKGFASAAALER